MHVHVCHMCLYSNKGSDNTCNIHVHCHNTHVHVHVPTTPSSKVRHLSDSAFCYTCTGFSRLEVPEQALDEISLDLGLVMKLKF